MAEKEALLEKDNKKDDLCCAGPAGLFSKIDDWILYMVRAAGWTALLWFNARYATSNPDLNEA